MGHTLDQWNTRVLQWLKDTTGRDVSPPTVQAVGIEPALSTYTADRPPTRVAEVTGAGADYVAADPAWAEGGVVSVEYPVGENPPSYLDPADYWVGASAADVDVDVLYLPTVLVAGAKVRVRYSGSYPLPTSDAAVDVVTDRAFPMVAALAAAYLCRHLATEAARDRAAALPTDFVGGRDRAQQLIAAANALEDIYRRYVGIPSTSNTGGGEAEAGPAPSHGRIDVNPSAWSLFHGGRR